MGLKEQEWQIIQNNMRDYNWNREDYEGLIRILYDFLEDRNLVNEFLTEAINVTKNNV